jgi:2-oxoglutarate ferredoxin oxidoreductase subunit beta
VNLLIFNNEIYGLTKGQYSPASPEGKITKSSPMGSIDHPFNPAALMLGADATFFARSMDRDPIHLRDILKKSNSHKGSSVVEIYQNCNVFNDGAFEIFTEKGSKKMETLFVESGKPLLFGENGNKGIKLDGLNPKVVEINDTNSISDLWIHDEKDRMKAQILSRFFDDPQNENHLPRPFGIFYQEDRFCYEDAMDEQILEAISKKGKGNLDALLKGNNTWTIA